MRPGVGQSARAHHVDRSNHHLFQPLLYQVAIAGLSPADIASPIRSILRKQKNASVLLAEVESIDLERQVVGLAPSEIPYREMPFDHLVVATGAVNHYFGHDDWAPYAVGLKTIDDALEIRRRVLLAFEAAERELDSERRRRLLSFVVVGGGPTGVELAGALVELSRYALARDFREIAAESARIVLVEGGPSILRSFHESLREKAKQRLEKMGVEVRTDAQVAHIGPDGVLINDELLPSATVLWAAGVSGSPLVRTLGVEIDRGGRVLVEPDCSVAPHRNVFVIGDAARFEQADNQPLPGVAPVAMQQGRYIAELLSSGRSPSERRPFVYDDKGSMATIGRSAAIVEAGRMRLTGWIAWLAWLLIHILYLAGFRNRASVLFNWTWSYLTYGRGARLITAGRMLPGAPEIAPRDQPDNEIDI